MATTPNPFYLCGPCSSGLHGRCVGDSGTIANSTCICAKEDHKAASIEYMGDGLYRVDRTVVYGPMRDVDYDLEPYEVRTNNEAGASKSKPRDDLDTALAEQRRFAARQNLRF